MPTPQEIGSTIGRAVAIARDKGVDTMSTEELRRYLAERLFRELRAELRIR